MSRAVVFARTSRDCRAPVLPRAFCRRCGEGGHRDNCDGGGAGASEPAVGDRHEPDSRGERHAARGHGERGSRVDGQRDTGDEHGGERHHGESGHQHRLPEARPRRVRAPHEHDHAPERECSDHRAPAERAADAEADLVERERAGTVRCVGTVDHRRREEEQRHEGGEHDRGDREPKLDLTPRDDDRDDLRGERARRDRMGQGQERGAHRVDGPPRRVAALDGAGEEGARQQHRGESQCERVDHPREEHDAERRREDE